MAKFQPKINLLWRSHLDPGRSPSQDLNLLLKRFVSPVGRCPRPEEDVKNLSRAHLRPTIGLVHFGQLPESNILWRNAWRKKTRSARGFRGDFFKIKTKTIFSPWTIRTVPRRTLVPCRTCGAWHWVSVASESPWLMFSPHHHIWLDETCPQWVMQDFFQSRGKRGTTAATRVGSCWFQYVRLSNMLDRRSCGSVFTLLFHVGGHRLG